VSFFILGGIMEVIIENVILDNFTIDFMLLFLSNKFTNTPVSKVGIILASLFGTGFSLISPLIALPSVFWIVLKLVIAFVIVLLAQCSFYKIFQRYFWFILLTFAFGGGMIAIFYFFGVDIYIGANITYFSEMPVGFIMACAVGLFILIITQVSRHLSAKRYAQFSVKVELCIRNKRQILRGFIDTGNNLMTKMNTPVVIINENDLGRWFTASERLDILLNNYKNLNLKNVQVLKVYSVGNSSNLFTFEADYLRLNNRIFDVAVGVSTKPKGLSKNFEILLNNKLIEV